MGEGAVLGWQCENDVNLGSAESRLRIEHMLVCTGTNISKTFHEDHPSLVGGPSPE